MRIYRILDQIIRFKMYTFGDHLNKLYIDTKYTLQHKVDFFLMRK